MKPKRSSTKFTFQVGYILIGYTLILISVGLFIGAVNQSNLVEIIWALLLSAAGMLGINLTRVAVENVASIRAASDTAIASPGLPEETQLQAGSEGVSITQTVPPCPSDGQEDPSELGKVYYP